MKKFLSIFVAVAMVFSLFTGILAPRASAAVGLTISTADAAKKTTATAVKYWFSSFPSPLVRNPFTLGTYVYKMGDVIHANVVFNTTTAGGQYVTELMAWNGVDWVTQVVDSVTAFQTTTYVAGDAEALKTYPVQIGTGNVSFDGPYYLRVRETTGDTETLTMAVPVYIQYNLTWKTSSIINCAGFNTIEGWITRGNGQTVLVPVIVGITYPVVGTNYNMAAYYTIAPSSSGQFSLTFPVDPANHIGKFGVFVRDSYADDTLYPVSPAGGGVDVANEATESSDNDAMVYEWLSNVPTALAITAATYGSPILLYANQASQPLVISLTDSQGNPVAGLIQADWTVNTGTTITAYDQISPGYYRFVLTVGAPTTNDVRFSATTTIYGTSVTSNVIIINLRTLSAFNPYLDINAINHDTPELDEITGRYVYDKLPCTIGNALELTVGYWPVLDPANWYIVPSSVSITVSGPVRDLDPYGETHWIIEEAGKITASISMDVWERIDQTCPTWPIRLQNESIVESTMAENACCHSYTKTFDVCEVKSCSLVSVTLENGAQTDASTITVGKKADLVVNVSSANAPAGLSCGCNTKIVHIYMTKNGVPVTGAFTVDTYAAGTSTVNDLWYNGIPDSLLGDISVPGGTPDEYLALPNPGRSTPDATFFPRYYMGLEGYMNEGTVNFMGTTPDAIVIDNCEKLIFKGVKFNYVDNALCTYNLVVQTFALKRGFDACGNMQVSYPFISETLNDVSIVPVTTTLTSIGSIFEGAVDPTDALAGVTGTFIELTDPMFTLDDPTWKVKLGSTTLSTYTVSTIPTGYKVTFNCPLYKAGDLVITGWAYGTNCATKELVTITKKVVLPAFDVKIGLADGTIIANDHIVTEGLIEDLYVVPTDPRADGHHDFTTDPAWNLGVLAVENDCGLPTAKVCGWTPSGCTTPSPISVYGRDNPHITDAPQFELYMTFAGCTGILIDTFTLVEPTITVSPTEIPFTIPASATHLVFTVKDAHAHGAPGVGVSITGTSSGFGAGASGYSFTAGTAITDKNGEADWAFVPPYSGQYYVGVAMSFPTCFTLPCSWSAFGATKTITAKYMAPVVDTTAPVVTLTAGLDGSKVSSSMLNLTGKVTDNVGVTQLFVGFNKVDVLPDGSFMVALKLVAGENTITVVAYDAAGNKGTTTAKVTYTAPVDTKIVLVLTIGADIVSVNGKATSIDAAPEIVASRTFVPIRFISESFGATVEWLAETQGITITLGDHTVGLQIGNATAVIDGTIVSLPAAPYIKNGRTMVPLRVISEAFGGDVVWDPSARTITITYQP
ncbi:MAG: stalk domain-containing protein [Caldisericia bacterium]